MFLQLVLSLINEIVYGVKLLSLSPVPPENLQVFYES